MYRKYHEDWCAHHGLAPPLDSGSMYLPLRQRTYAEPSGNIPGWVPDPEACRNAAPLKSPVRPRPKNMARDVMISYSHADKDMMARLRDGLERHGITVWVDTVGLSPGVNFLSKIGQAIVDAKLFISMVSRSSIKSKFCQDELALAYVSSKPIFPVALEDRAVLFPLMGTDVRLQLAGFKWTPFHEPYTFEESFQELLTILQHEKNNIINSSNQSTGTLSLEGHPRPVSAHSRRRKFYPARPITVETELPEHSSKLGQHPLQFWSDNFGKDREVAWTRFWATVCDRYREEMQELYGDDRRDWLSQILQREMSVTEDILCETNFLEFCTQDGEYYPFWVRMEEQAKESVAMKEVFNMESSVRVEAIENLSKFNSPAVVDALTDLLADDAADIRAVAAISLARLDSDDDLIIDKLKQTLRDPDRLVREAGCIAMGKLKIKSALKELLHIWRNDVIADVRASAELALHQIGGPDVDREMKVTKVLGEEIRMLTNRL